MEDKRVLQDKVLKDLSSRGAELVAFVVCCEDKSLQVLEYDKKGDVSYLSKKLKNLHLLTEVQGGGYQILGSYEVGA